MCQSAVFKSNQCEKHNPVHQRFDVRNRDGAVDTSYSFSIGYSTVFAFFLTAAFFFEVAIYKKFPRLTLKQAKRASKLFL